jgi:hypothetical protein
MIIVSGSDTFNSLGKLEVLYLMILWFYLKWKVYLTANILSSKSSEFDVLYLNLKSGIGKAIKFRIRTNNTSVICNFIDFHYWI